MRAIDKHGRVHQTMHAVFDGSKQLTTWRTCKVATIAALSRSSHAVMEGSQVNRGRSHVPLRDRALKGLTIRTQVFVTPAREKGGAK